MRTRRATPKPAASSSPTPSSNSALWATNWFWATKCSRPIPRASGRRTPKSPADRNSPSTSNSYGTTWNRFAGTSSRRLPRCRKKWPPAQAKNTARLTACSPVRVYELAGCSAGDHCRGIGGGQFPQGALTRNHRIGQRGARPGAGFVVLRKRGGLSHPLSQLSRAGQLRRIPDRLLRRSRRGRHRERNRRKVSEGDRALIFRDRNSVV